MNATRATALLLAAALAACTTEPAYPTEVRRVPLASGKIAELYGAPVAAVCEAVADAACDASACRQAFAARCNPSGAVGRIEATTLERWDGLWAACLDAVASLEGYAGDVKPTGCELLLPRWL